MEVVSREASRPRVTGLKILAFCKPAKTGTVINKELIKILQCWDLAARGDVLKVCNCQQKKHMCQVLKCRKIQHKKVTQTALACPSGHATKSKAILSCESKQVS